jgi:Fibronectin type III domain
MTDPESVGQGPPAASAWAAPGSPVTAGSRGTGYDPAAGQPPPAAAPRRRRRWAVITVVAVVVLGLAAGLVVWAPWTPPPVLRPAGLVAGPSTATSVTMHWSAPRTGPLPDKYLILSQGGTVAGSASGKATSYRQTGLDPATTYLYRVVAVRGGKRSPQSALLTVHTLTPPISQARLQGSWSVYVKNIGSAPGGRNGYLTWQFSPACATGPCDVTLHGRPRSFAITMKLTRAGEAYQGRAVANLSPCGPRGNTIPDPTTLTIRIHIIRASGQSQVWAATAWAGTMVGTSQYVSSATFYCTAATFRASLAGTPG